MMLYSSPPMYSFGSSIRGEELKTFTNYHTPGPGTYDETNQEVVKDAASTWKIGTSKRPNLYGFSNTATGPGSYDAQAEKSKKHPETTFPKGKRGQSENKGISTVGPDAYNPKKINTKAPPAFSFGYKGEGFGNNGKSDAPGPGAYDIEDPFDKSKDVLRNTRSAFTRTAPQALSRSKDPQAGNSMPGPGYHFNPKVDNYDFRYFTPTWSFGKSNRDGLYNDGAKAIPGPGKYNIAGTVNAKTGFTILGRNKIKGNTSYVPAPNVYNQDANILRKTAPAFRIGKAIRKDMSTGTPEFPGPGAYYNVGGSSDKGTRIGTSQRPGLYTTEGKKLPGPGEYEVRGDISKGKKYSMGIKGGPKKIGEVFPGPGEYEPFGSAYLEQGVGAIIGTSERPPLYKKGNAPGPGQYDVRGNIGVGTKSRFGTHGRQGMAKLSDEPGPGYYNIPSAIANVQKYLLPYYAAEIRKTVGEKEVSFRGIFGGHEEEDE